MTDPTLTADVYYSVIPEWLLEAVSPRAYQVYGLLRRYADAESTCFPSRATLAKRLSCSKATIDRAVDELVRAEALEVYARRDKAGDRTSNLYRLRMMRGGPTNATTPLFTDAEGGSPIDDEENQSHLEPEPVEPEVATLRRRDVLWETVVEIHGEPATKSERGKFNRVVKNLREAGVTPDEYPILVGAYATKHDGLQPAVATVAERVGELRHYVARGPIRAVSGGDVARAEMRAILEGGGT